jgi:hypothetical protein
MTILLFRHPITSNNRRAGASTLIKRGLTRLKSDWTSSLHFTSRRPYTCESSFCGIIGSSSLYSLCLSSHRHRLVKVTFPFLKFKINIGKMTLFLDVCVLELQRKVNLDIRNCALSTFFLFLTMKTFSFRYRIQICDIYKR